MPYIKEERRNLIDNCFVMPTNAGELNYLFTMLSKQYFNMEGKRDYQAINDIIGALEGCKLEFYRRLVASYENKKIEQNGDVY